MSCMSYRVEEIHFAALFTLFTQNIVFHVLRVQKKWSEAYMGPQRAVSQCFTQEMCLFICYGLYTYVYIYMRENQ
jgi:hypothetical protein